MSQEEVLKTLKNLKSGDLICCSWCDANIGKSRANHGVIEVPVKSWGIFVMLLKGKVPTILLAQNCFEYANGVYDVDYTAIPLSWAFDIKVLEKQHVSKQIADGLAESFMMSGTQVARSAQPRAFLHRQKHLRRGTHGGRMAC